MNGGQGISSVVAVILAAGMGSRVKGREVPKQFLLVCGKPVLQYCLEAYSRSTKVNEIVLVGKREYWGRYLELVESIEKSVRVVEGGRTRQESLEKGLSGVERTDYVVLQNGANPLVETSLIELCIDRARQCGASTAFVRNEYTAFQHDNELVTSVMERRWSGQTRDPQVFLVERLLRYYATRSRRGEEGSVHNEVIFAREEGCDIGLVECGKDNFKITTVEDIWFAEAILMRRVQRKGRGG